MAKKLYLCFLWHMHQPYYKNPQTGKFEMPWVFLHGIKSYYDMPWLSALHGVKATFNLVPSLITQLYEYKNPENCQFLSLWAKDVSQLTLEEKRYILRFLFSANPETMIKPLDRYYQLFLKKHRTEEEKLHTVFSDEELVDLEVLFLLSWCGNYLRQNSQTVKELIHRGRNFSQEDKTILLDELTRFVTSVVDHYKQLMEEGKIEISVSPFYHPIIPLLVDYTCAKESKPDIVLPDVRGSFTDFAVRHINQAKQFFIEIFGKQPVGIWSSEGGLSNDTLKLFQDAGFLWTATDEQVLFNSVHEKQIDIIYRVWTYGNINIFFRDRHLSDGIGFRYYYTTPQEAVKEFIGRLAEIYQKSDHNPVVSIILDGENPWEHYPEGGYHFLTHLYNTINQTDWIEATTLSEVLQKDIKISTLDNIVAGSWIYGNFTTWIGHQEKNTAWEYLDRAVSFYRSDPDPQQENLLMAAQGSDWFWWYGDDHFSVFSDIFDNLFRLNLKRIYTIKGIKPPSYLDRPIKRKTRSQYLVVPTGYISPLIDGKISNYFEWLRGGEFDLRFDIGSMTYSTRFERVLYGYDLHNLYLYLQGMFREGDRLVLNLLSEHNLELQLEIKQGLHSVDISDHTVYYCFDKGVEVSLPLAVIDRQGEVELSFSYISEGRVVERLPAYSNFTIKFENFDHNWFV